MAIYGRGRPAKYRPADGKGTQPPAVPGEYRIRNSAGDLTYIGETNNLKRRMQEHIRSGKLTADGSIEFQTADGRSTSRTRREHERQKIEEHRPPLNRSHGGEGRPAGR